MRQQKKTHAPRENCNTEIGLLLIFFFQAEDGIRHHCVTGVQTCALPISAAPPSVPAPRAPVGYDPEARRRVRILASVHSAAPRTPAPVPSQDIANIRAPFRQATLLPAAAYHDEAVYAWEREEIFFRDWIAAGRAEEVPEAGSFVLRELFGEQVIIVRGRDDVIRAFYNVCRHRGTAVEERECGRAVRFQCPYHAWIYDLDGSLVRAKHTEDVEDFSFASSGLTPVRCDVWNGFIFLCFADETVTPPLPAYLGDWSAHHADFGRDLSTLRRAARL